MSRLPRRRPLVIHDPNRLKKSRTIAELLACIESALTADDWGIEPGSIDTRGLTVAVDGLLYRLDLTDEDRRYPSQEAYEARDAYIGGHDFDEEDSYVEPEF